MPHRQDAVTATDLDSYVGYLIRRAHQTHVAIWQGAVSADISSPQFGVMAALARRPGSSQHHLCVELGLDRSTIADLVSRLAARGTLSRSRDHTDHRRNVLFLTDAGLAAYEALLPKVAIADSELTSRLSEDDRITLHRLLCLVTDRDPVS